MVSTRLGSQLVVTFSRVVGFLEPRANSSKSNKYPDNRRARQNRSRATAVWGTRGSFRSRARRDGARASSNRATETRRAPTRERREGEPRNVRPTNRVFRRHEASPELAGSPAPSSPPCPLNDGRDGGVAGMVLRSDYDADVRRAAEEHRRAGRADARVPRDDARRGHGAHPRGPEGLQ